MYKDTDEEFTTTNYGIRTKSNIEWNFVVKPEPASRIAAPQWPKEQKLLDAMQCKQQGRRLT